MKCNIQRDEFCENIFVITVIYNAVSGIEKEST